jgi:hypothetical protein
LPYTKIDIILASSSTINYIYCCACSDSGAMLPLLVELLLLLMPIFTDVITRVTQLLDMFMFWS